MGVFTQEHRTFFLAVTERGVFLAGQKTSAPRGVAWVDRPDSASTRECCKNKLNMSVRIPVGSRVITLGLCIGVNEELNCTWFKFTSLIY